MKKLILLIYLSLFSFNSFSQAGEWTWMNGDTINFSQGHYGTKGVPDPLNSPPALSGSLQWTDLQGNFWLYGGSSYINPNIVGYADLWKYDPLINEWTWVFGSGLINDTVNFGIKGIASSTNTPGSRGSTCTWVDLQGNLWLYGGVAQVSINGQPVGELFADLWKYNIATNQWTWVNGYNIFPPQVEHHPPTNNHPGSRTGLTANWTDNAGNLWFYGGIGDGFNNYGDLWKYEIASDIWTLMKGDTIPNHKGSYGFKGISNVINNPGCRFGNLSWKETNGDLWLFGGLKNDTGSFYNQKNDLWKYSITTNMWTWMNGDSIKNAFGNLGLKCISSIANQLRGQWSTDACWSDGCGNFWTFGGVTLNPIYNRSNDLWMYSTSTGNWTWISGNGFMNGDDIYGIKGVSTPTNSIGARDFSNGWIDFKGNFWIFGARSGYDGRNMLDYIHIYANPPVPVITISNDTLKCVTSGNAYQWYFNNMIINGATDSFYVFNVAGNYYVTIANHGCEAASNIISKPEMENMIHLVVMPNPANLALTISFIQLSSENVELRLYDALGNEIYFSKHNNVKGRFEEVIRMNDLASGIYFCQLKTQNDFYNKKVIVQH